MFLFLTLLASQTTAQYCTSGPTLTADTNLGATNLTGDNKSITDTTDCTGDVGPRDLTTLSADVSTKTYTLSTTVTSCGGLYSSLVGAWIDWNQNSIFEDNEIVGAFSTLRNVTWNFSVPSAALIGTTRLRVQVQETLSSTLNPCQLFAYGGTKDFTIQVKSTVNDLYCVSGPTTNEDSNLGAVTVIGESRNIREATDCPGKLGPQNFLEVSADLRRGQSYTLSFNVTTCGDVFNTSSAVWIDYDHDLLFSSAELAVNYTKQQGVINAVVNVPATGYTGDTVMRVQVQETEASKIDPCSTFSYGGTKDFTITLLAPKPEKD